MPCFSGQHPGHALCFVHQSSEASQNVIAGMASIVPGFFSRFNSLSALCPLADGGSGAAAGSG
ncbi:MAG: hypothetical protein LBC10_02180, partial [Deltaproteobacteria bacterium]|nr:hypothetical protein [Deltaproteobacteria bacterium]